MSPHTGLQNPERHAGFHPGVTIGRIGQRLVFLRSRIAVQTGAVHQRIQRMTVRASRRIVGGNRESGKMPPQNFGLKLQIGALLRAVEPETVQHKRGTLPEFHVSQLDFIPGGIILTPEAVPPGAVEFFERPVALLQPFAERFPAAVAVAESEDGMSDFIVDLKTCQIPAVLQCAGQFFHQTPQIFPVDRRGVAGVLPDAEMSGRTVRFPDQDLGMPADQPCGSRAGRAEDDADSISLENTDGRNHVIELKFSVLRLQSRPCELSDADETQSRVAHQARIVFHTVQTPLLRIISGSDCNHEEIPPVSS